MSVGKKKNVKSLTRSRISRKNGPIVIFSFDLNTIDRVFNLSGIHCVNE